MGVYCFTELGSVWVTATLWSLHCVKWTLLMRASPPLFKDLTCDLFPWVLLEKPLILNYWYFLPCRRTSVLSAASLFLTLLSGREVIVGLVWVFYREPRVSVTPFCEASCLQRAGPLICSQPEEAQKTRLCLIGRCLGVLRTTVSGWVICVILQLTVRSP